MKWLNGYGALLFGVLAWSGSATVAAGSASNTDGSALYHDYCSVCHGDRGDGRSRAMSSMVPAPRDFTSPAAARDLDRDRMLAAVRHGRPGTAMAPWASRLSAGQIEAVVDYVLDRFMAVGEGRGALGARLYARTCSVCHGDDGRGARWTLTNMHPRPRDFSTAEAAQLLTRERMLESATFGRADTAMPGFGTQLRRRELEAVVDFIRTAFMRPSGAVAAGNPAPDGQAHTSQFQPDAPARPEAPFPDGLRGDRLRGEALYRFNCVACHGEYGNGRGPRAYFILPKPRNFTHPAARQTLTRQRLYAAIARGSVGSEMPAWDKVFDAGQIADVAEYVFQRFITKPAAPAKR